MVSLIGLALLSLLFVPQVELALITAHLCECITGSVLLRDCFQVQGFARNSSTITLIVSNNIYLIPVGNLVLGDEQTRTRPVLYMSTPPQNGRLIKRRQWLEQEWFLPDGRNTFPQFGENPTLISYFSYNGSIMHKLRKPSKWISYYYYC